MRSSMMEIGSKLDKFIKALLLEQSVSIWWPRTTQTLFDDAFAHGDKAKLVMCLVALEQQWKEKG